MNNDLEQFSEERLKKLIDFSDSPALVSLARIVLAAKQTKPVGYFVHTLEDGVRGMTSIPDDSPLVKVATPLYTTPQPAHTEQSEMLNKARSLSESIGELRKQIDSSGGYDFEALRNEQVNSPAIPDGWIKCSDRMPEELDKNYQVVALSVKKYDEGNYIGEPKKTIVQDWVIRLHPLNFTHWMTLAAAPKPESE